MIYRKLYAKFGDITLYKAEVCVFIQTHEHTYGQIDKQTDRQTNMAHGREK